MRAAVQIPRDTAPHLVEVLRRMEESSSTPVLDAVQAVTSWMLCGGEEPLEASCNLVSEALLDRVVESAQAAFDARNPQLPELGAYGFEEWSSGEELAACWLLEQLCGEPVSGSVRAPEYVRPPHVEAAMRVVQGGQRGGLDGLCCDDILAMSEPDLAELREENDALAAIVRQRFGEALAQMRGRRVA